MKRYFYTYHTGDKDVSLNVFNISREKYEEIEKINYTTEENKYIKMMDNNIFHCENCYFYICNNFFKNDGFNVFQKDDTKEFQIVLGIKSTKLLTTNELEDSFRYVLDNKWEKIINDLFVWTSNKLWKSENLILETPYINKIDLINLNNEFEYLDIGLNLHPKNIWIGYTGYRYYNNAVKKIRKNQLFKVD
ncbi:hypothetical protein [Mycoplasma sp. Z1473D]